MTKWPRVKRAVGCRSTGRVVNDRQERGCAMAEMVSEARNLRRRYLHLVGIVTETHHADQCDIAVGG